MLKKFSVLLRSFPTKITLLLILSMLFAAVLSDALIYEHYVKFQFNKMRENLTTIAKTSVLMIDADILSRIPMNRAGADTEEYKLIISKLRLIKDAVPKIAYIYTLAKTANPGIYKFIVDADPEAQGLDKATAWPGDEYDGSEAPEMAMGFTQACADKKIVTDAWGKLLSGYAPIRNASGKTIAILGMDIRADDVYNMHKILYMRAIFVFLLVTIIAVAMGIVISIRITGPIKNLVDGTRHLAAGDLEYKVKVIGDDEIAALAKSFNKMSGDILSYISELKRTTAEKESLLKELEIAKDIQRSFLPLSAPRIDGAQIASVTVPAKIVGGDFYDFIPIDKERWGLLVADVSGKGMPAALFMALSRTVFRASAMGRSSISDVIVKANRLIIEDSRTSLFVTLFYAMLNYKEMKLEYANEGHNPPLLIRRNDEIILLKSQGIPLGLVKDIEVKTDEVKLEKGDIIAIYTDGIVESVDFSGEQFQTGRLSKVIIDNRALSSEDIVSKVKEALTDFVGDQPQFDDITLMIIKIS